MGIFLLCLAAYFLIALFVMRIIDRKSGVEDVLSVLLGVIWPITAIVYIAVIIIEATISKIVVKFFEKFFAVADWIADRLP